MWWESVGRGWRGTPGATRRFARRCLGSQQLEDPGLPRGARTSYGTSGAIFSRICLVLPWQAMALHLPIVMRLSHWFSLQTLVFELCQVQNSTFKKVLCFLHLLLVNGTRIVWYIVFSKTNGFNHATYHSAILLFSCELIWNKLRFLQFKHET